MAFDFGRIGKTIARIMDSDYIDIKRDVNGKLQEIYTNIPCHVSYASTDNPDPTSVDVKPIIQSISVHLQNWVDIQNNDFLVAKKIDSEGNIAAVHSGRCGNPVVSQGRKKVSMQMNGTEAESPSPIPPKDGAKIIIKFISADTEIQDAQTQTVEVGKPFDMEAPTIEGYSAAECYIDSVLQEGTSAHIDNVENDAEIRFLYEISDIPQFFRFLVNGLYTKDDGSLASGWHLYKKIDIDSVSVDGDVYEITSDNVELTHEDGGQTLAVEVGAKIVLIPGSVFVEVSEIVEKDSGKVTFKAVQFEPTENEKSAYVCGYYD